MITQEFSTDQAKRIALGEMAKNFLDSREWKDLMKPIIEAMITGARDATTIDVSSDKKAAIEVKSRTLAVQYLEALEAWLQGYVADATTIMLVMDRQHKNSDLYKSE